MQNRVRNIVIIVIAPARTSATNLLNKARMSVDDWSCVMVGPDGNTSGQNQAMKDDVLFMLINQLQDSERIEELLKRISELGKRVIVYTHKSPDDSGYPPFQCYKIADIFDNNLIGCQDFTHPDTVNENYPYLLFMQNYGSVPWNELQDLLTEIINDIVRAMVVGRAHKLRSEILTPFIAFHLFHQLPTEKRQGWEGLLKKCSTGIECIDITQIVELNVPAGMKCKIEDEFRHLRQKVLRMDDCRTEIEELATGLEIMVSHIESREEGG